MFKHILVPTDFGEPADHALDVAIELARKFDSKLTIFHAYEVSLPMPYTEGLPLPVEEIGQLVRAKLDQFVDKTRVRYGKCEGAVEAGFAWERILDRAAKSDADLIVMGTHGRRGLPRALMGSVTEKVARMASIPVLTVSTRHDAARQRAANASPAQN
jgi:nucleotide-binding universal stress UspA family protein